MNKTSKYTEDFKKKVVEAALEDGATLKAVGERFSVNPTLVRNWRIAYGEPSPSEVEDTSGENYQVCLTIGSLCATHVETEDGDWIDETDDLASFRFSSTATLDASQLTAWCNAQIDIDFDGDLDDPSMFQKIMSIKVYGPSVAEYTEDGLLVEGVSFYMSVNGAEDMEEADFEDLFHLIVPIISHDGATMGLSEFENYSATFEEAPSGLRSISSTWEE